MKSLILLTWLLLASCDVEASCASRGGKLVFSHFITIWTGKSSSLIPQYKCKLPAKDTN